MERHYLPTRFLPLNGSKVTVYGQQQYAKNAELQNTVFTDEPKPNYNKCE